MVRRPFGEQAALIKVKVGDGERLGDEVPMIGEEGADPRGVGMAEPGEREVRSKGLFVRRDPGFAHDAFDVVVECGEAVAAGRSGPEHTGAPAAREDAHAPDPERERRDAHAVEALGERRRRPGIHLADEAKREVDLLRTHPADPLLGFEERFHPYLDRRRNVEGDEKTGHGFGGNEPGFGQAKNYGKNMMIRNVISGGQTGVDRATLDAAMAAGLPVGGWCPRGRRAADGVIDARYPLRETPSADYAERTAWNVRDADGTLVLVRAKPDGGTALTIREAERQGKPCLVHRLAGMEGVEKVREWIAREGLRALNVAGPREEEAPGIYTAARAFLTALFSREKGDG